MLVREPSNPPARVISGKSVILSSEFPFGHQSENGEQTDEEETFECASGSDETYTESFSFGVQEGDFSAESVLHDVEKGSDREPEAHEGDGMTQGIIETF